MISGLGKKAGMFLVEIENAHPSVFEEKKDLYQAHIVYCMYKMMSFTNNDTCLHKGSSQDQFCQRVHISASFLGIQKICCVIALKSSTNLHPSKLIKN